MENIRDILLKLVRAAMEAKHLQDIYCAVDIDDTPAFHVYSEIADAIYHLIGEETDTFEESVTCTVLEAPVLTDERRTNILYGVYSKYHGCQQPKPHTFSNEEFRQCYKRNGGYCSPEGDWQ